MTSSTANLQLDCKRTFKYDLTPQGGGGGGGGWGVLHLCYVTLLHFCLGENYRNYKNCDYNADWHDVNVILV